MSKLNRSKQLYFLKKQADGRKMKQKIDFFEAFSQSFKLLCMPSMVFENTKLTRNFLPYFKHSFVKIRLHFYVEWQHRPTNKGVLKKFAQSADSDLKIQA